MSAETPETGLVHSPVIPSSESWPLCGNTSLKDIFAARTFHSTVFLSASGESWPVGVQTHSKMSLLQKPFTHQYYYQPAVNPDRWGYRHTQRCLCCKNLSLTIIPISQRWILTGGGTDTLKDVFAARTFHSPVLLSASGDSWPVGVQTRSKMALRHDPWIRGVLPWAASSWGEVKGEEELDSGRFGLEASRYLHTKEIVVKGTSLLKKSKVHETYIICSEIGVHWIYILSTWGKGELKQTKKRIYTPHAQQDLS